MVIHPWQQNQTWTSVLTILVQPTAVSRFLPAFVSAVLNIYPCNSSSNISGVHTHTRIPLPKRKGKKQQADGGKDEIFVRLLQIITSVQRTQCARQHADTWIQDLVLTTEVHVVITVQSPTMTQMALILFIIAYMRVFEGENSTPHFNIKNTFFSNPHV